MTNTSDNATFTPEADAADLVERLQREGLIGMRAAAALYVAGTHSSTPTRHHLKGVKLPDGRTVRLEAIRVGGRLLTSRAAVLRFFAAQQSTGNSESTPPTPTPNQLARAAAAASARVKKLLNG